MTSEPLQRLLEDPRRSWPRQPGAGEDDLVRLAEAAPGRVPEALVDLPRYSNGGEGGLALAPRWFVLDRVDEIIESLDDSFLKDELAGLVCFGSNGGLERWIAGRATRRGPS
jgi:hypothetical protein